jgi:hypothetical protein
LKARMQLGDFLTVVVFSVSLSWRTVGTSRLT